MQHRLTKLYLHQAPLRVRDARNRSSSLLRGAGAEVVIATLTEVLGRYAAPVGASLIEEMYRACRREPHGLGEVMLHLRRRLLGEGNLTVLSLAAFGDADWLITADGVPC